LGGERNGRGGEGGLNLGTRGEGWEGKTAVVLEMEEEI